MKEGEDQRRPARQWERRGEDRKARWRKKMGQAATPGGPAHPTWAPPPTPLTRVLFRSAFSSAISSSRSSNCSRHKFSSFVRAANSCPDADRIDPLGAHLGAGAVVRDHHGGLQPPGPVQPPRHELPPPHPALPQGLLQLQGQGAARGRGLGGGSITDWSIQHILITCCLRGPGLEQ